VVRDSLSERLRTRLGDLLILIPEPPLTPIAPTTFPRFLSGMPPAKIIILPLFEAWIPKN